jgi:hypothetical protein
MKNPIPAWPAVLGAAVALPVLDGRFRLWVGLAGLSRWLPSELLFASN